MANGPYQLGYQTPPTEPSKAGRYTSRGLLIIGANVLLGIGEAGWGLLNLADIPQVALLLIVSGVLSCIAIFWFLSRPNPRLGPAILFLIITVMVLLVTAYAAIRRAQGGSSVLVISQQWDGTTVNFGAEETACASIRDLAIGSAAGCLALIAYLWSYARRRGA